jgi:hypothetical protein
MPRRPKLVTQYLGRWFWHFERSSGDWVRIRDK